MPRIVPKPPQLSSKTSPLSRRFAALLCPVMLACLPALLSGCYVLQAAGGQAEVISRSHPIAAALSDPAIDPATRAQLQRVVEAREFAVRQLGLPDGRSYRDFADLGRPYVVWNLVAAPEFSVRPRRWCFPFAGCIAYRGYFKESDARAAATRYTRHGDDVMVGGVGAYSTLGHFADPVFGSMLRWPETRLVGTIFHELAHEQLYVKDDSAFNEAYASVIEEEGVRRWLSSQGREPALAGYAMQLEREAAFATLLRTTRRRLARLYASDTPIAEMRIEKQREFGRLKHEYQRLRTAWAGYPGFDAWFAQTLNNAHLAAVATYQDCAPGLRRELARAGSLPAFQARAAALAKRPRTERHAAVCRYPGAPP